MTLPLLKKGRGTKEPLDESKRREWRSWLKTQHSKSKDHGIWSHHLMVNRWGNKGNSDRLYFGGSKITAHGDCSHELERCLLLERKAMTNLDSILKSRDITNKGPSSQGYGFSSGHVWMWELDYKESWVSKNWGFWTVVLEKTLENPWTARRSNQSILKEISPEYSLEGLMLKLKL